MGVTEVERSVFDRSLFKGNKINNLFINNFWDLKQNAKDQNVMMPWVFSFNSIYIYIYSTIYILNYVQYCNLIVQKNQYSKNIHIETKRLEEFFIKFHGVAEMTFLQNCFGVSVKMKHIYKCVPLDRFLVSHHFLLE